MKFLFYLIGLGAALGINIFPSLDKPRPLYAKLLTIVIITLVTFLALYPPTVGTFADAVRAKQAGLAAQEINVRIGGNGSDYSALEKQPDGAYTLKPNNGSSAQSGIHLVAADAEVVQKIEHSTQPVIRVVNDGDHSSFRIVDVVADSPFLALPYIPVLEERARIMYFHVPMSWVALLAYAITLVCSVQYLRTNKLEFETKAASSAAIGTLFCALAYITGALWAKFNWGKFFNWDTRELSILVLLLIYGAYFALRGSVEGEERRARLTSVYAIVACVAAAFLMFIVPRITESLHPGSQGDVNAGPLVSPQSDALNVNKAFIFSLSLTGFTMLYFWILNLAIRMKTVEEKMITAQEQ